MNAPARDAVIAVRTEVIERTHLIVRCAKCRFEFEVEIHAEWSTRTVRCKRWACNRICHVDYGLPHARGTPRRRGADRAGERVIVTALADLVSDRDRRRLLERLSELGDLADLMRQPGGLPSMPELAPLHRTRRDTTTGRKRPRPA